MKVIPGLVHEYVVLGVHLGSRDSLPYFYNYDIRIFLQNMALNMWHIWSCEIKPLDVDV